MRQKTLCLVLLFVVLLAGGSCNLPEGPDFGKQTLNLGGGSGSGGPDSGEGILTLLLPGTANVSRSVLSDSFIATLVYRLTFTHLAGGGVVSLETGESGTTVSLLEGDWTIDAEAYVSGAPETTVGTGSDSVTIVPGESVSKTISMYVDQDYEVGLTEFYIHNETELGRIGAETNGLPMDGTRTFHLVNDIDLTGSWTPIGGSSDTPFRAVFNGHDHSITIKSFNGPILDGSAASLGFFAYTAGATVKNTIFKYELDDPAVDMSTGDSSTYYGGNMGGVAGYAADTSFENIQVTGNFSVTFDGDSNLGVGGIVGQASNVTISRCHVSGAIGGSSANYLTIGGIAGNISNTPASIAQGISESSFAGTISGNTPTGNGEAGGIAGLAEAIDITDCFAEGHIKAEADSPRVGGIAGIANDSSISESYAAGVIESIATTSHSLAGGIAGSSNGTIENCYAWADVSTSSPYGENAGGIAGENNGTISKCYAAGTVQSKGLNPYTYIGGIAGYGGGNVGACMALVSELDGGPSSSLSKEVYAIGCFYAGGTFSGNYSRNDITYKNYTNSGLDFGSAGQGGEQKPPDDFKSMDLYTGALWIFNGTGDWHFVSGYDYPVLSWQDTKPGTALEEASSGEGGFGFTWPTSPPMDPQ